MSHHSPPNSYHLRGNTKAALVYVCACWPLRGGKRMLGQRNAPFRGPRSLARQYCLLLEEVSPKSRGRVSYVRTECCVRHLFPEPSISIPWRARGLPSRLRLRTTGFVLDLVRFTAFAIQGFEIQCLWLVLDPGKTRSTRNLLSENSTATKQGCHSFAQNSFASAERSRHATQWLLGQILQTPLDFAAFGFHLFRIHFERVAGLAVA